MFALCTYGFEATIHDTNLLAGELGLSTQIFEGDWDRFRYTGRLQLKHNFFDRTIRWRGHCVAVVVVVISVFDLLNFLITFVCVRLVESKLCYSKTVLRFLLYFSH